jgi:hypothetical protein
MQWPLGNSDISDLMRGGVQYLKTPSSDTLSQGEAQVATDDGVGALPGYPTVSCPDGADDFPVPPKNTQGPPKSIQHVFLFIRENKDFDGLFGDLSGVAGEPSYALKTKPGDMDKI